MNVLITGVSSGLGYGLAKHYLANGHQVLGLSRRTPDLEGLTFAECDINSQEEITSALDELIDKVPQIDLLILNAGVLGNLEYMTNTPLEDFKSIMHTNVWANKLLLDEILKTTEVSQVVTISSGAAVNGNKGWGAYSMSKAALNMLTKLYAAEYPETHFCALAPGLIDTAMQDYLCGLEKEEDFPSINKLKNARGTENMPGPDEAGQKIAAVIPELLDLKSGSFTDVRSM